MTDEELEDWKKMFENPEKIYVSQEAYDKLVEMINRPPSPEQIESIRKLMNRKAPWD